ncbi:hypothetical protein CAJAP_01500 [Camponotus japonicus]
MTLIQFETLEEKLERRREECIQLHSVLADHTHKKRKRCRKRLTENWSMSKKKKGVGNCKEINGETNRQRLRRDREITKIAFH